MLEIRRTQVFAEWLDSLRDERAKARIASRLRRLARGNPGDHKSAGGHGVMELRIDSGPGYRVYYLQRGKVLVVLLCGGDKDTQANDIKKAQKLAVSL